MAHRKDMRVLRQQMIAKLDRVDRENHRRETTRKKTMRARPPERVSTADQAATTGWTPTPNCHCPRCSTARSKDGTTPYRSRRTTNCVAEHVCLTSRDDGPGDYALRQEVGRLTKLADDYRLEANIQRDRNAELDAAHKRLKATFAAHCVQCPQCHETTLRAGTVQPQEHAVSTSAGASLPKEHSQSEIEKGR